jgi:SAM-dependent methyltransferase
MRDIQPEFFRRIDESPDRDFYREPRFVTHIDDATIAALTEFYEEFLPPSARVLDLMSSWISHLPETALGNIIGLGMNAEELAANARLDEFVVQDLNLNPRLPYPAGTFDRVLIAVSIQYLVRPVEVLTSACNSLADDGQIVIAMSHRLFPTKAIAAFSQFAPQDRIQLVQYYLQESGFQDITFLDRSPPGADPLWLVTGRKSVDTPDE